MANAMLDARQSSSPASGTRSSIVGSRSSPATGVASKFSTYPNLYELLALIGPGPLVRGRPQLRGREFGLSCLCALVGRHGRIVMVRVSADDLVRPNQFLVRLEDLAAGAGNKPDCDASRDQRIEEWVASKH